MNWQTATLKKHMECIKATRRTVWKHVNTSCIEIWRTFIVFVSKHMTSSWSGFCYLSEPVHHRLTHWFLGDMALISTVGFQICLGARYIEHCSVAKLTSGAWILPQVPAMINHGLLQLGIKSLSKPNHFSMASYGLNMGNDLSWWCVKFSVPSLYLNYHYCLVDAWEETVIFCSKLMRRFFFKKNISMI